MEETPDNWMTICEQGNIDINFTFPKKWLIWEECHIVEWTENNLQPKFALTEDN